MAAASEPAVAFSLLDGPMAALRGVLRAPVRATLPFLVLLLPLIPLLAGLDALLREGGSAALAGVLVGAPPGTQHALILEPDAAGRWQLVAGFVVLVCCVGVLATAALVPPAAPSGSPRAAAIGRWPTLLLSMLAGALVTAAGGALVMAVAVLSRDVQFQLPTVIAVLGLGALAIGALRLTLWPALALAEDLSVREAARRSWRATKNHQVRLVGAAVVTAILTIAPALLIGRLLDATLTALADQELLTLSPVAIDLWALLPVTAGVLGCCLIWGRVVPRLAQAIGAATA